MRRSVVRGDMHACIAVPELLERDYTALVVVSSVRGSPRTERTSS
jgi:hypothetical protein